MAGRDTTPDPNVVGRPSDYSQELGDYICEQLASGESLRKICEADDMPSKTSVFRWLRVNTEFRDQYAQARVEAKYSLFDDMLNIAADGTNDWMEDQYMKGKTPGWKVNGEAVQRSKLRVDTIKWQLSKLEPKVYGDKLDLSTNGKDLPQPILGGISVAPKED